MEILEPALCRWSLFPFTPCRFLAFDANHETIGLCFLRTARHRRSLTPLASGNAVRAGVRQTGRVADERYRAVARAIQARLGTHHARESGVRHGGRLRGPERSLDGRVARRH